MEEDLTVQKLCVSLCLCALFARPAFAAWPAPQAPAVSAADGYVVIPGAAVPPDPSRIYRVVWDATRAAEKPSQLLPALNMAGSELNAFEVTGVQAKNVKFVVVFHGDAMDGILNNEQYQAKFGVSNPNLAVLNQMKARGVEFFVCGQNVAFAGIDPATLSPLVKLASDALIVLMSYQNQGYALLSF
jgi:intracellular sulfur oxidation DsrE/DsrF family protein